MIDPQIVDKLYEMHRSGAVHVNLETFDKRRPLPLEAIAQMTAGEDGHPMEVEALEALAARGWFEVGETQDGQRAAPAYVTERVQLLRDAEVKGYREIELVRWVRWEEYFIEWILTADEDSAYIDDDLELVTAEVRTTLDAKTHGHAYDAEGNAIDRTEEISELKKMLGWCVRMQGRELSPSGRDWLDRTAFRVRASRESIRALFMEHERAEFRAGYSAGVSLNRSGFAIRDGELQVEPADVEWSSTVESALAQAEEDGGPALIRIPGFLIEEDHVMPLKTMIPSEYDQAWRAANLDGFLEEWARKRGDRRCQHCFAPLPDDANRRRVYCGESCRVKAKGRRYRERNPGASQEAQLRYYRSIFESEGASGPPRGGPKHLPGATGGPPRGTTRPTNNTSPST